MPIAIYIKLWYNIQSRVKTRIHILMSWHKNTLLKYRKEITHSAVLSFVLALVFAVYSWHLGNTFVWESISPIEQPSILVRAIYSALTFATLGAIIYALGFYKILYAPYRGVKGGYKEYKKDKKAIWGILILLMYFIIIPVVVNVLNAIASFFYNIFKYILYLPPTLGIFLILTILISYIYSRVNKSPVIVNTTKN